MARRTRKTLDLPEDFEGWCDRIHDDLKAARTLTDRWRLGRELFEKAGSRRQEQLFDAITHQINKKHGRRPPPALRGGTSVMRRALKAFRTRHAPCSATTLRKMAQLGQYWTEDEVRRLEARGLSWRWALKLMRFRRALARRESDRQKNLQRAWDRLVNGAGLLEVEEIEKWIARHGDKVRAPRIHPARFSRLPKSLEQFESLIQAGQENGGRLSRGQVNQASQAVETLREIYDELTTR